MFVFHCWRVESFYLFFCRPVPRTGNSNMEFRQKISIWFNSKQREYILNSPNTDSPFNFHTHLLKKESWFPISTFFERFTHFRPLISFYFLFPWKQGVQKETSDTKWANYLYIQIYIWKQHKIRAIESFTKFLFETLLQRLYYGCFHWNSIKFPRSFLKILLVKFQDSQSNDK